MGDYLRSHTAAKGAPIKDVLNEYMRPKAYIRFQVRASVITIKFNYYSENLS